MTRVATYNVRYGKGGLDDVIATVRDLNADILALQELDVGVPRTRFRNQPRTIARALGREFVFARASRVGMVADAGGLRVATGHLSIEREEAQRQLDVLGRALTARRPPWLLLGDLNLRPADVVAVLAPLGLALASTSPPTYPAAAPTVAIDHIAAGGGMVVVEGSVMAVTGATASDHRPLVGEVR